MAGRASSPRGTGRPGAPWARTTWPGPQSSLFPLTLLGHKRARSRAAARCLSPGEQHRVAPSAAGPCADGGALGAFTSPCPRNARAPGVLTGAPAGSGFSSGPGSLPEPECPPRRKDPPNTKVPKASLSPGRLLLRPRDQNLGCPQLLGKSPSFILRDAGSQGPARR